MDFELKDCFEEERLEGIFDFNIDELWGEKEEEIEEEGEEKRLISNLFFLFILLTWFLIGESMVFELKDCFNEEIWEIWEGMFDLMGNLFVLFVFWKEELWTKESEEGEGEEGEGEESESDESEGEEGEGEQGEGKEGEESEEDEEGEEKDFVSKLFLILIKLTCSSSWWLSSLWGLFKRKLSLVFWWSLNKTLEIEEKWIKFLLKDLL